MLAQQAAEKALKAALIYLGIDPPRSHNLLLLADLLPPGWAARKTDADLARLTLWSIEARYPGDWPEATSADGKQAARDARVVFDAVDRDLVRGSESA